METDPKRDKIFSTAQTLFFKHGVRRISIEEICREADISKMTFYKHFKDKNDLIRAILHRLFEDGNARHHAIMNSEDPFPAKIRSIIRLKLEQSETIGNDFIQDLYRSPDPEIVPMLEDMMRKNRDAWMSDFADAQAGGRIRPEIRPEFILYFIDRMTEMVVDEKLLAHYASRRELLLEIMNFFFYGILAGPDDGRSAAKAGEARGTGSGVERSLEN